MMKLVFSAALVAVAVAVQPAQYPANVSPHDCPNYPFCGNTPPPTPPRQTGYANPAPASYPYAGQPSYTPSYNPAPASYNPAPVSYNPAPGGYSGYSGSAYGAPAGISNYLSGAGGLTRTNFNTLHGAGPKYPAGIQASTCPNYPLC